MGLSADCPHCPEALGMPSRQGMLISASTQHLGIHSVPAEMLLVTEEEPEVLAD